MPVVGTLSLYNTGAYVARLGCAWIDPSTNQEGSFPADGGSDTLEGQTGHLDPGTVGCPTGAQVWALVDVVAGEDQHGSSGDGLIYEPGDTHTGLYHIHGWIDDTTLGFDGVQPPE